MAKLATDVTDAIETAADKNQYYTKDETNEKLDEKVNVYDLENGMYTVTNAQYAVHSNDAATDRLGNIIEETYATKDEIIELQEQISEVANQTEESGQTAQEAKGIAEKALSVAIKGGLSSVSLWSDVPDILRKGMGSSVFQTGYEFEMLDSDTGNTLVWAVRDHNKQAAADSNLDYTMTLELKHVYSNANGMYLPLQFDAPEALYYAADGLPAGTYHVTVAQASYTNDSGKTFQFTLTTAVPTGGQIVLNATYNTTLEGQSVQTYASPSDTTVIETATLTEGSEGTSLGTTDGAGNMNHMPRIAYGSNNYAQGAARQWLNSGAAAGSVWTPQTKFDRPPSWAATYNGFMHGLPAEFLAVVQPAIVSCRTNSVYECASLDGTAFATDQVYNLTDKFFILSRPEIYGTYDSTTHKDGEQLEYYAGLTNTEIIKYDAAGTARNCWLRSPAATPASRTRITSTDGSMGGVNVYNNNGIAPACIIA